VSGSAPAITNNLILRNASSSGGGIHVQSGAPLITNDVIYDNWGFFEGAGITSYGSPLITNCIVRANFSFLVSPQIVGDPSVRYSDVEGGYNGEGDIDADPLFVDAESDNFHLQPGSPCVSVGDVSAPALPAIDFEGDPRVLGPAPDMGVDEFVGCFVVFREFGTGMPGSGGLVPTLTGGSLGCGAGEHSIIIENGLGGASGRLWVGLATGDLYPFYGGHLYISFAAPWVVIPIQLGGPPGVAGAGTLVIPGADLVPYAPLTIYLQASIIDAGSPYGVALTPALELRAVE
jgi:hypothetical protein